MDFVQKRGLSTASPRNKSKMRYRIWATPRVPPLVLQEICLILNDRRSWFARLGLPFVAVPEKDPNQADWHIDFRDESYMSAMNFGGLSVTSSRRTASGILLETPETIFNTANWNRPPVVSGYSDDLLGYHQYVVNHEFGHVLGEGHRECASQGSFAPIMLQQTKGLHGCMKNPWPLDHEVESARMHQPYRFL